MNKKTVVCPLLFPVVPDDEEKHAEETRHETNSIEDECVSVIVEGGSINVRDDCFIRSREPSRE